MSCEAIFTMIAMLSYLLVVPAVVAKIGLNQPCDVSEIQCGNSSQCFAQDKLCDRTPDCDNGFDESPRTCLCHGFKDWFLCEDEIICIPPYLVCDEYQSCVDNSDEKYCPTRSPGGCYENEVNCGDTKQCILKDYVCNGRIDCDNYWDEEVTDTCPCLNFLCPNSTRCISLDKLCDDNKDCAGGEDEPEVCPECYERFQCAGDGTCINKLWKCDGYVDCKDGTDELRCPTRPPPNCQPLEFACPDGSCISPEKICNLENNCRYGEDEYWCPCQEDYDFRCDNGECVRSDARCNARVECRDESDEFDCASTCDEDEIFCELCVPEKWFCDYVVDCPDGSDEQNCNYTMVRPSPAELNGMKNMHASRIQ